MSDIYWQVQFTPVSHGKLYYNVGGKIGNVQATVPKISSLLRKLVPSDRMVSAFFFDPSADLAEDVNENIRLRIRKAIGVRNHEWGYEDEKS